MMAEKNSKAILTTPPAITEHEAFSLTGNEYLSLPHIGAAGGIDYLNVLHMEARGLLEFSGKSLKPLLAPFIFVNNRAVALEEQARWSYRLDWIPCFEIETGEQLSAKGEIFTPPGRRGGCYRLGFTNHSSKQLELRAGWQGYWGSFNHIIFNRRPAAVEQALSFDDWTNSLILEARRGLPLAALALAIEPRAQWELDQSGAGSFRVETATSLEPGESAQVILYFAVNLEADGAGTTAVDLMRRGSAALAAETESWLEQHRLPAADKELAPVLNRNLFFNYFYALGRALDTDGLVPVTSRSPRYYVSAAFWSRDALLWSFPGLLLVDSAVARELLLTVFERHLGWPGEHAHYINGIVLYPGFELDQLAAYLLALQNYVAFTGDQTILAERTIDEGVKKLKKTVARYYDHSTGLYATFLDPSDDPVRYPFLIYSNALLERAFNFLGGAGAAASGGMHTNYRDRAQALRKAIYRHGTVKGPYGPMFAWAVDGRGQFQLYDNPPGSLLLLAYYGFCSPEDTIFKNTVAWIRSSHNPYFHQGCAFGEAGSLHCANPWPLAAANDLLAFAAGGADFLKRAPMDQGFCCETVDPHTGRVSTGAAFASAAGFLAHAIYTSDQKQRVHLKRRP